MAMIHHEIPILEYDTDLNGIIMPDHEQLNLQLPKKAVFAFLNETLDSYAKVHNAKILT